MRSYALKIVCLLLTGCVQTMPLAAMQMHKSWDRPIQLIALDDTQLTIPESYVHHACVLATILENKSKIRLPLNSAQRQKCNQHPDYDTLCLQDLYDILQTIAQAQEPTSALEDLLFKDENHPSTQRCIHLFALANHLGIKPLLEVLIEYVGLLVLEKKESRYATILKRLPIELLTEIFYRHTLLAEKI